jgi:Flp pilus assembly protein TadG
MLPVNWWSSMPAALLAVLRRFRSDARANIAVTFAVACLPILAAIGCASDYSLAARMKAKLQSAADTASLAAISRSSAGYNAALLMTQNGAVPVGVTDANNVFNGNVSNLSGYNNLSVTSTVVKTGSALSSTVQFSASMPTLFLGMLGYKSLTVIGSSTSAAGLPLYLDFYLILDVSGSMGLPSTTSEAQRLQAINPDNYVDYPTGCTFACHLSPQWACWDFGYPTNGYCMGYAISRVSQSGYKALLSTNAGNPMGVQLPNSMVSGLPNSLYSALTPVSNCSSAGTDSCIQLRLDAVGSAVNQLLSTANSQEVVANQFRVGLYPFIQYLYSYFPLTSSINGSASNSSTINYAAANLASLLDTDTNTNLGSGGTHIDTALSSINGLITSVGNGTGWNNTLPYVFLITDGAQDNQTKGVPGGSWAGSNSATVINPSTSCGPLTNRGIIVSVLYIPYQPISPVNASFGGDEDDAANNNIANIPASLQDCASTGYFYSANTPADITSALNSMFNHAVTTAHIKN